MTDEKKLIGLRNRLAIARIAVGVLEADGSKQARRALTTYRKQVEFLEAAIKELAGDVSTPEPAPVEENKPKDIVIKLKTGRLTARKEN